jgi:hypothetical protein
MTGRARLVDEPVLALTVRPPWSHWLAAGVKQVENRTWCPPAGWRGALVIHAGQRLDWDGFVFGALNGHPISDDEVNRGEYLAVADLVDVHAAGQACGEACAPWGRPDVYHWVLAGVRRLVTVEGRGRQRLFVPPHDVVDQVLTSAHPRGRDTEVAS